MLWILLLPLLWFIYVLYDYVYYLRTLKTKTIRISHKYKSTDTIDKYYIVDVEKNQYLIRRDHFVSRQQRDELWTTFQVDKEYKIEYYGSTWFEHIVTRIITD